MGKIIALIVIAAVAWFIYSGDFDFKKSMDNVKDASVKAVKNETTFNKINANRELNEDVVNRMKQ